MYRDYFNSPTLIILLGLVASFERVAYAQSSPESKKASEKFNNVSILTEMPADEMGKVMNMMSASLGVNCNFCHEGTNFAKENVGKKDVARKMLEMTLSRRIASVPTVLGAFEFQVTYRDYKVFAGLRHPTLIQFAIPNITWTRQVTAVETNVQLDDSIFQKSK